MVVNVIADGLDQFFEPVNVAVVQPVLGQVAEESLDHVQPRVARVLGAHVNRGMAAEPAAGPWGRLWVA